MAGYSTTPRTLAQPRLVGGVAVWLFLVNLGVAAEAMLLTGSLVSLPIALAAHVGGALARRRRSPESAS